MKKVLLSDLQNGMITAEDVYDLDGQLVVPKGIALTENIIAKIFSFDIFSIRIEDTVITTEAEVKTEKETEASVLEEPSYAQKIKSSPEFVAFQNEFHENVAKLEFAFNMLVEKNVDFDANTLLADTLQLIKHRSTPTGLTDLMLTMQDYDDCTYAHSINVAMICNIFAGWLHFSPSDQILATACGLFHDIGKLQIPTEILHKPGKLTSSEFQKIKSHPLESYKMIARFSLPDEVKNTALMHHERCDGSGYPYGFTHDKISPFAKLVAIADVYEAMTSNRSYREAICPFHVITHFENDGLQKYDPGFLLTFLENVANTFLNQKVRLSNGLEGNVIYINPIALSKPTLQIGEKYIDLKALDDIKITKVL